MLQTESRNATESLYACSQTMRSNQRPHLYKSNTTNAIERDNQPPVMGNTFTTFTTHSNFFGKNLYTNGCNNVDVQDSGRVAVSNGMSIVGNDVHVLPPLAHGEVFSVKIDDLKSPSDRYVHSKALIIYFSNCSCRNGDGDGDDGSLTCAGFCGTTDSECRQDYVSFDVPVQPVGTIVAMRRRVKDGDVQIFIRQPSGDDELTYLSRHHPNKQDLFRNNIFVKLGLHCNVKRIRSVDCRAFVADCIAQCRQVQSEAGATTTKSVGSARFEQFKDVQLCKHRIKVHLRNVQRR